MSDKEVGQLQELLLTAVRETETDVYAKWNLEDIKASFPDLGRALGSDVVRTNLVYGLIGQVRMRVNRSVPVLQNVSQEEKWQIYEQVREELTSLIPAMIGTISENPLGLDHELRELALCAGRYGYMDMDFRSDLTSVVRGLSGSGGE